MKRVILGTCLTLAIAGAVPGMARAADRRTDTEPVAVKKQRLLDERRKAEDLRLARGVPRGPLVAPVNDDCAGAEVIPAAGPFPYLTAVTADITDATATGDPPAPSCQSSVSRSIWYTFTPSTTSSYTISTCADAPTGSTVDDTVVAVYTSAAACAGPFTQVVGACDDDSCVTEALQSVLTTTLTSGTTYYIVVWEFGTTPPTAGNTAVQLRVTQVVPPANDTCAGVVALALATPVAGSTSGATNDYALSGAGCFTGVGQTASTAPGGDVVYSFTAPAAGSYSFRVTNYSTARNLVLYTSSSCPAAGGSPVTVTCVAAANRNTANPGEEVMCRSLAASEQVFLFVDENALGAGSAFTVEVTACTQETEPNGTPATANAGVNGIEGSITPAADADFFSVGTPAAGSRLFALVDGVAANSTDFDLRVTTATDTLEYDDLNNDIPFGSLGPNIEGTPLTGVESFLRVNHFSATTQAEPYRLYYTVRPSLASAITETEPNDTIGQATSDASGYFSGALSGPAPSTDVDMYAFSATAGDLVFVGLDGDPLRDNTPVNAALAILDSGGIVLVSVNDGGSTSSTTTGAGSLTATTPNSPAEGLVYRIRTSGTYYARVSIGTASATSTGAGDYLLSISGNTTVPVTLQQFTVE